MNKILFGDCRELMFNLRRQGVGVQTCVTSPPYFGLRDYGVDGQMGLEGTIDEYVQNMVDVFQLVRDLLKEDGTLWLNLGDSYGKNKQLLGIPWRVALALQADGWYLRQDIIWHKPNPMPESVTDRCVKAHEYIFLFSKSRKYYFDHESIKEPMAESSLKRIAQDLDSQAGSMRVPGKTNGPMKAVYSGSSRNDSKNHETEGSLLTRNKRSVWQVPTKPYKGAHFATFPVGLIEPCIQAGSRENELVFDPFMGSGTTAAAAILNGRQYLGCELNQEYECLQQERILSAIKTLREEKLKCEEFSKQLCIFGGAA